MVVGCRVPLSLTNGSLAQTVEKWVENLLWCQMERCLAIFVPCLLITPLADEKHFNEVISVHTQGMRGRKALLPLGDRVSRLQGLKQRDRMPTQNTTVPSPSLMADCSIRLCNVVSAVQVVSWAVFEQDTNM